MAVKLKHTLTGGVVEVSEDAVDRFRGFGFEAVEDEKPAEKTSTKRAPRKSTSTSEDKTTE